MSSELTPRQELLLKMYDQMYNDINRHIMITWQSIGTLIAAVAFLGLAEKNIIPIDLAISVIVLICGWLLSHIYDSAYWYNRNLVIIANIERQFLNKDDLLYIHYYFGKHRKDNKMIEHLCIQKAFAYSMIALVVLYHFVGLALPSINFSKSIDWIKLLPYASAIAVLLYSQRIKGRNNKKYAEFLANSPGIELPTEGIHYGIGHGYDE